MAFPENMVIVSNSPALVPLSTEIIQQVRRFVSSLAKIGNTLVIQAFISPNL